MATVQDIEIRDSAARAAQAAEELQDIHGEKMVLNMGPSHPATHGVSAHRAGAGRRNHHQGRPGRGLSASRRRKNRREHDLHPVHPLHGPAGLSRAAGQQRRLRAGGGKAARHPRQIAAALPVHPRDVRGTGAHFRAFARARRVRDGHGRGDGFPADVHRARKNLQSGRGASPARASPRVTRASAA